jgi:hypothetical protein
MAFPLWLHKPERDPRRLTPWPMARLLRWAERVNKPLTASERHAVRTSVNRGTPLGDETWVQRIAQQHNLQSTLRPRGRPKNESWHFLTPRFLSLQTAGACGFPGEAPVVRRWTWIGNTSKRLSSIAQGCRAAATLGCGPPCAPEP